MPDLHLGILVVLGIAIVGGAAGAWLFQKLKFPQVVGYIIIGVLIGQSGFKLVSADQIEQLGTFNLFALGVIGFLVGGELHMDIFRKYGKQFMAILLGEGLAAFLLVLVPCTLLVYWITHNLQVSLATGIVFGAIASATDPASTLDVLWENRSRGTLTTAVIAIVALDDALAMTLYGLGTGVAQLLASGGTSLWEPLMQVAVELLGAILLGVLFGFALNYVVKRMPKPERALGVAIGVILLSIGIAAAVHMDVILSTMTIGAVLTNLAPRRSRELFSLVRGFSGPIYVLFFVLVGARLSVGHMPPWIWGMVVLYVVARSVGKYFGARLGARLSGAEPVVRENLGMALFAQGGVAVGLSIMAAGRLGQIEVTDGMMLGDMIIFSVTASTLIVQLIGPPFVKLAVKRSGEGGRDVQEEDIMAEWTVADVMIRGVAPIREQEPVSRILQRFADADVLVYPVVEKSGRIAGIISLESLKDVVPSRDCWDWMVASDVMAPSRDHLPESMLLKDALDDMARLGEEALPVVQSETSQEPVGVLDVRSAGRRVTEEVVRRRS